MWISLFTLLGVNLILLSTVVAFRPIYNARERLKEVEDRPASSLLNRWMREYWLWLTDPLVRFFSKAGVTPNTLTIVGVLISLVSGYFFWQGRFGLGGWFMIGAATFDIFDGRVARATGAQTKSGAYFDSVMDRVSEGILFLGLALYYKNHWALWIVIVALVGSTLVSYAKARGEADGAAYSGGSMQRPERIVYLGVGAIFAPILSWAFSYLLPITTEQIYLLPLGFVAIMTWITSLHRVRKIMHLLDHH